MQLHFRDSAQPSVQTLEWHGNHLRILDQRCLPQAVVWVECHNANDAAAAIVDGVVQGAVAVGLVAAYGIALAARGIGQADDWRVALEGDFALLAGAAPSSAHLDWVLGILGERLKRLRGSETDVPELLIQAAANLHASDLEMSHTVGRLGAQVLRRHNRQAQKLLVLGNTRALLETAHEEGLVEQVYLCRGDMPGTAQLAHWELKQHELPVTLHTTGAAGQLMRTENLNWVIVGAHRIAANGDVINDLGTYSLAVLAMHHGLRFMVIASSSAFDLTLENADELDANDPLLQCDGELSLDVTPADLIDVIITERGVVERPDENRIAELLSYRRLH